MNAAGILARRFGAIREQPFDWLAVVGKRLHGLLPACRQTGGCIQWLESKGHAPSEEVRVLRPATAAISLSMPLKIQRCTG